MSLKKTFESNRPTLSIELFPPKTEKGEQSLYRHVEKLVGFSPDFVTCTYGAGGSTRDKTLEIVHQVKRRFSVPVASHLTLVGSTIDQLRYYLNSARDRGIDHIVALRGDPPYGQDAFEATEGGLRYANELVELVHNEYPEFGIAVAGYPEMHVESPSRDDDLRNLKRKVDAGADVVVTQLFYHNDDFFRFCDSCREIGIEVPIVPGILPVTNLQQIQRISALCGAKLPDSFVDRLGKNDDKEWQFQVGVEFAIDQTRQLIDSGVSGLHFYVLNQSRSTLAILDALQINAQRLI